jgi:hypothetical protein
MCNANQLGMVGMKSGYSRPDLISFLFNGL